MTSTFPRPQSAWLDGAGAFAEKSARGLPLRPPGEMKSLSTSGLIQLAMSTVIFLLAASTAKSWALSPSMWKLVVTLLLYTGGNLIMLRLVREFGMAAAFSLSAVIQLVAVTVIAFTFFGERMSTVQSLGVALAIFAVCLITLGPWITGR
jgi:drug/metabolite transporter (DMT)-like permease